MFQSVWVETHWVNSSSSYRFSTFTVGAKIFLHLIICRRGTKESSTMMWHWTALSIIAKTPTDETTLPQVFNWISLSMAFMWKPEKIHQSVSRDPPRDKNQPRIFLCAPDKYEKKRALWSIWEHCTCNMSERISNHNYKFSQSQLQIFPVIR